MYHLKGKLPRTRGLAKKVLEHSADTLKWQPSPCYVPLKWQPNPKSGKSRISRSEPILLLYHLSEDGRMVSVILKAMPNMASA